MPQPLELTDNQTVSPVITNRPALHVHPGPH